MHFSTVATSLLISGASARYGRWPGEWKHHSGHGTGVAPTGGFPTAFPSFPSGGFYPTGAVPSGVFPSVAAVADAFSTGSFSHGGHHHHHSGGVAPTGGFPSGGFGTGYPTGGFSAAPSVATSFHTVVVSVPVSAFHQTVHTSAPQKHFSSFLSFSSPSSKRSRRCSYPGECSGRQRRCCHRCPWQRPCRRWWCPSRLPGCNGCSWTR